MEKTVARYYNIISATMSMLQTLTTMSSVPRSQFPESKLSALNKTNAGLYTHAAPQYGGGVLGYLHVFHELHCLVCTVGPPFLESRGIDDSVRT